MDPTTVLDHTSYLQYGALGILAVLLVFICVGTFWGIRAVWKWLTDEHGPVERVVEACTDFVAKQGECNRQMAADHAATMLTVAQIRRAGKRAVGFAREVADKLDLSDNAKQCLKEAETELES